MESIKVALRVRPMSDQEKNINDPNIWKIDNLNKLKPIIHLKEEF